MRTLPAALPQSPAATAPSRRGPAFWAGDAGAVLMEYVVLCCLVAIPLLLFMMVEKKVGGEWVSGFYNVERGYIGLGKEWVEHVRLLHRAIALPIP